MTLANIFDYNVGFDDKEDIDSEPDESESGAECDDRELEEYEIGEECDERLLEELEEDESDEEKDRYGEYIW